MPQSDSLAPVVISPSNAPEGYPTTSPEGYPYFYPIGGDGKPTGAPRLMFANQTFKDVAEINQYLTVMARRKPADFETPGTGMFPPSYFTSAPVKAAYLRGVLESYKHATNRDIFFDIINGPMTVVNDIKQLGDILNPGQRPMETDDATLKAEVERLFKYHSKNA